MQIDLHMHSNFSDGRHAPTQLVEMALDKGLAAISLTDHDSLEGVPEFMEAGREKGVETVPGVELSAEFDGRDLHILGYGVDPDDSAFQEMLKKFRDTRYKRGIKIVERLNALGVSIDPADVLAKAGKGALGRPHIASVLVEKGIVPRVADAFDKYIADGGPAYVPKYKMNPTEAIEHVHAAGGLAFVAHPGIFLDKVEEMDELLSRGFDGVEVFHPSHNGTVTEELQSLAERRGLLVSGGSDFHGFNGKHMPIGAVKVPYTVWTTIQKAIASRRGNHG
ncbi:MAG: PHP domain-containing protein [Candidatus Krumholzibacteriia bacterium]